MSAFDACSKVILETVGRFSAIDIIDVRFCKIPRVRPQVTAFDPRDFRTPRVEIKPWMAYFNLLRTAVGTGVLSAPMAMSQVGVIIGPLMIVLTGLLVIHTHLVLLWCLNEISRQLRVANISYRYGFRLALLHGPPCLHAIGRCGPFIIATFMMVTQIAICTGLVIFTASCLRDAADFETNAPAILILFFPFFLWEMFMKNLRIISQVALGANILNAISFILVVHHMVTKQPAHDLEWKPKGWVALLNAFGTILFNFCQVGVIISCDKALRNPRIMTKKYGVVRVGLLIQTVVSFIIGSTGYYAFGGTEENIIRYLPFDDITFSICNSLYCITAVLSYPLQCLPCIQIVTEVVKNHDPYVSPSNSCITAVELIARAVFVILTFLIAYLVPVQSPLVAFVGSFCTTLLVLVFPALMEIGLCYPEDYGRYNYILAKDILIVLLGIAAWLTGTRLCGYLIYVRLISQEDHPEYL